MTTKTKKEDPTYVTTTNAAEHPIARAFPAVLDVPLTFRRTSLEVRDEFRTTMRRQGIHETDRERFVRVVYALECEGVRTEVEIEGESTIEGVEFGPDGTPTDPAKWSEVVKRAIDNAIGDARRRLDELISLGFEAEKKGED